MVHNWFFDGCTAYHWDDLNLCCEVPTISSKDYYQDLEIRSYWKDRIAMPKHGTPEKYNIFAMCGEQLMDLKSQSMKLLMILLSHDSTMG